MARAMDDQDGYFDERVAARYDESSADMFDLAVVDPVVDVLADLAGRGRALELGIGTGAPGETILAFHVSETRWGIDEYDVATQDLTSHHFEIVDGRVERLSVPFRYTWPAELDLMAQLAGMRLRERWGDWSREPFTSTSRKHVSVWEKPAA
jgi:hypothetical protein